MSAFYVNKCILVGNVSKDAQLKSTQNGSYLLNFSIATNRSIKKGEEWQDVATFHNVVFWGNLAKNLVDQLIKGAKVYVEGRIDYRKYEDPKSGQTKYFTEIIADTLIPFSPKGNTPRKQESEEPQIGSEQLDEINLDEIPF